MDRLELNGRAREGKEGEGGSALSTTIYLSLPLSISLWHSRSLSAPPTLPHQDDLIRAGVRRASRAVVLSSSAVSGNGDDMGEDSGAIFAFQVG